MEKLSSLYQAHPGDAKLMHELLGFTSWTGEYGCEIHLGEVRPYADEEPADQQTVITIFVTPIPAQFCRFEIVRKADRDDYQGMEAISISTGSGTLSQYWPMALAVANGCLSVSAPQRIER